MTEWSDKSDKELIRAIRDSRQGALEALIERYRSKVELIAMNYIHSPLERDDLIQEGMIGLLAAIHSYNCEKGAAFGTYAARCINNSVKTALKKFSRLKDIPPTALVALDDEAMDAQTTLSAEDEFLAKESVFALTEILYEGLSSFENQVLRLYIMGHTYTEISERLGKNPKAIDNAIQRIRKKLEGVTF